MFSKFEYQDVDEFSKSQKCLFLYENISKDEFRLVLRRLYEVAADYKIATVSAWSYPIRYAASQMGANLPLSGAFVPYNPSSIDFAYLTPSKHQEFGSLLADEVREKLYKEIDEGWACTWMQDGSMDLGTIENEFHAVRYVTKNGELKSGFAGLVEKEEEGAAGQTLCYKQMLVSLIPKSFSVTVENVFNWISEKMKPSDDDLFMPLAQSGDDIPESALEIDFHFMPQDWEL